MDIKEIELEKHTKSIQSKKKVKVIEFKREPERSRIYSDSDVNLVLEKYKSHSKTQTSDFEADYVTTKKKNRNKTLGGVFPGGFNEFSGRKDNAKFPKTDDEGVRQNINYTTVDTKNNR
jgi:hypothetical protein